MPNSQFDGSAASRVSSSLNQFCSSSWNCSLWEKSKRGCALLFLILCSFSLNFSRTSVWFVSASALGHVIHNSWPWRIWRLSVTRSALARLALFRKSSLILWSQINGQKLHIPPGYAFSRFSKHSPKSFFLEPSAARICMLLFSARMSCSKLHMHKYAAYEKISIYAAYIASENAARYKSASLMVRLTVLLIEIYTKS